jgi:CBS-domain-containing membrane protein
VIAVQSTVKDIMTTRVVAVHRWTPFKAMTARLRADRVSAFPVVDDEGKVVGVVSETDMLPKETLDAGWAEGRPELSSHILRRRDQEKAESLTAGDLMTEPAVTAAPEDTVEHAARLMYVHEVKRLPVIDDGGQLVGIISRADVLSVFNRPDAEIRKDIAENVILAEIGVEPDQFTVSVENGIVTLAGLPSTGEIGRAIVGRARHVEGVVAVRDRLQYPPS